MPKQAKARPSQFADTFPVLVPLTQNECLYAVESILGVFYFPDSQSVLDDETEEFAFDLFTNEDNETRLEAFVASLTDAQRSAIIRALAEACTPKEYLCFLADIVGGVTTEFDLSEGVASDRFINSTLMLLNEAILAEKAEYEQTKKKQTPVDALPHHLRTAIDELSKRGFTVNEPKRS